MTPEIAQAVHAAAERPEVRAAVTNLYDAVQDAIDLRRPLCSTSGRCCRFDEFGHRLYVTTLELAAFAHQLSERRKPSGPLKSASGCPFQIDGLCSVHAIRPFGCRIFFCDATSTQWQHDQYERFHAELKRLHGELGVPYFYVEWREALAALLPNSLYL